MISVFALSATILTSYWRLHRFDRLPRFGEFQQVGVCVFPQVKEAAVFCVGGLPMSGLPEQSCQLQDERGS